MRQDDGTVDVDSMKVGGVGDGVSSNVGKFVGHAVVLAWYVLPVNTNVGRSGHVYTGLEQALCHWIV